MDYPKRVIKAGETDASIVRELKKRLNEVLVLKEHPELRLDPDDPSFDPKMTEAVELFQGRHVDLSGRPLKVDGQIGPATWGALFGETTVPVCDQPRNPLLAQVLKVAAGEEAKHVREIPVNSNRGPQVEKYLASTDTPPGNPWCCAFVHWCFEQAAQSKGRDNPMVRTAGCIDHWNRAASAGAKRIPATDSSENPALVEPGMIFIMDHGGGKGHTGLVEKVAGGLITTIEGNTDASKTREGGGVYRLVRKISDINKGFIAYS